MRLFPTEHFIKSYESLPSEVQTKVDKQLSLLLKDPRHPSLGIKKIQGAKEHIFEGRVSKSYRFTFRIEKDTYILRKVGPHNHTLNNP